MISDHVSDSNSNYCFEIRGKNSAGLFNREKNFIFRTSLNEELQSWLTALTSVSNSQNALSPLPTNIASNVINLTDNRERDLNLNSSYIPEKVQSQQGKLGNDKDESGDIRNLSTYTTNSPSSAQLPVQQSPSNE